MDLGSSFPVFSFDIFLFSNDDRISEITYSVHFIRKDTDKSSENKMKYSTKNEYE